MTRENYHVEVALLVSLMLHAALFGSWQYRGTFARLPLFRPILGFVTASPPPVQRVEPPLQTLTFVEVVEPPVPQARTFMETSPSQVTGEQPESAEYYSDKATVAANPENPTGETGDTPYIAGTESRVMSTETVVPMPQPSPPAVATPLPAPKPLSVAKPAPAPEPRKAEQPAPTAAEGLRAADEKLVAMIAPEFALPPIAPSAPAVAPAPAPGSEREIAAAKSKLTASGSIRHGVTAFNVAASPFGAYDQKIVRAVQTRWYALIDRYAIYERAGTVGLRFELHDDGTLHNMSRTVNSANEILALYCEKAIVDSAPFDPLPEQLRVLLGKEPREVNFTFFY